MEEGSDFYLDYSVSFGNYSHSFDFKMPWLWNFTIIILMAVFGIVANTALLLVIVLNRHLRTMSNMLVGNLAVADLIMFAFSAPFDIVHWYIVNWPSTGAGNFLCKLGGGIWTLSQVLCVTSLTAVSIERYCSVRWQIHFKRTAVILIAVWIISLAFTVPVLVWAKVVRYTPEVAFCHTIPNWHDSSGKGYVTAAFVLKYVVPVLVITCCYVGMATILVRGGAGAGSEAARSRRRLVIVVLLLSISFAVCWFPTHFITLYFLYASLEVILSTSFNVYVTLIEISHILGYVNSCLNPVVVFSISTLHRRPLVHFLLCRPRRQEPPADGDDVTDRYAKIPEDVAVSETEYVDPRE